MATVNPGELKEMITVLVPQRVQDANGHYTIATAKEIKLHAAVKWVKASDALEYGAARAIESLLFTVRFRRDITTDMRIQWRGKVYDIESVDPAPYAQSYMRIRALSYDQGVV